MVETDSLMHAKTINHIFTAHTPVLVCQIIEKTLKYSKFQHHFIIIIYQNEQESTWESLFKKLNYTDYEIWYNYRTGRVSCSSYWYYIQLLVHGIFIRYKSLKDYLLIWNKVKVLRHENVILHSELEGISILLLAIKARVYWCSWGNIPVFSKPLRFYKKNYYTKQFLDKCVAIMTLTDKDRDAFANLCKNARVVKISYSYIYDFDDIPYQNHSSSKILVGNSALYIPYYNVIIELFQQYKGADITFMCSYGIDLDSGFYKEWKSSSSDVLNNCSTHYWEQNLSLKDYNIEISTYKVYIAPMYRQSGIGAITTALSAGVKCYLTGVNYDYFSRKGLIVYNLDELKSSNLEDILRWDDAMAQFNINLVREVCGVDKSISEWEDLYSEVI